MKALIVRLPLRAALAAGIIALVFAALASVGAAVSPSGTPAATGSTALLPVCHPSYPTVCIPPPPPDLECSQIPYRQFTVRHDVANPDPHGFDPDHNGVGCET